MSVSWQSVRPKHQVLIGAAIGLIALVASFAWDKWNLYHDEMARTQDSARRTSELLVKHTERVFDGIDAALREITRIRQEAEAGQLSAQSIHRMLLAVHGGTPVLRSVGWVDGDGTRLATSDSASPSPLNIANTTGFRILRSVNNPDAPPFISEQFYSAVLDADIFFAGRSMADQNGAFAGLVYGTVDPLYFTQVFSAADLGLDAVVTLSRLNGSVLARHPAGPGAESSQPVFRAGAIEATGSGILASEQLQGDASPIVGYATTADRRFVLTTSVQRPDALADFYDVAAGGLWRLLLVIILLVAVAIALYIQIDRREAVANRLRYSEARFRDYAEASSDWFWETDAEHRMVWMSRAVEHTSHASAQWHMGKRRIDMCARELMSDPNSVQEHQKTLEQHLPFSDFEYPRRSPSGIRWIRTSGVPIFDADGTFTGYRGSARDITDFVDAKERLRDATDAIPGGFMLFNEADELIYQNAPSQQPTGHGFVERLGDTFETIVRRVVERGFIEEAREDPEGWIRWRMNRHMAANSTTQVHINGRAIEMVERMTSDGGRVLLRFDVTDREMAYEEIRQARDAADAANKAKSDFLASMSHELRTPLNAIIGFGEILQRAKARALSSEQVTEYSGYIVSSGQLLLGLVNDVLDLSSVEAGRMKVSLESLDVRQMIERAVESVRPLADHRSIELQVEIPPHVGNVRADSQRSVQVLLNLLSNAIKYNKPNGFVQVHVEQDDDQTTILVTDSGPGISAHKAARLFAPFERLGAEFGNIEGTGIGLALSKKLVTAMSGQIGYLPAEPAGSTFWLSLPRCHEIEIDAEPGSATAAAPASVAATAPTPALADPDVADVGGFTLLCIEDNPINMRIVEHAVSALADVTFVQAETGLEGIERATSLLPDVIVLDLNLPDLHGHEVHSRLLANPDTRDIPVIALTAAAMPQEVTKGMAKGFFSYLTKPMDFDAFRSTVTAALSAGDQVPEPVQAERSGTDPVRDQASVSRQIDRARLSTLRTLTPRDTFIDLVREACAEIDQRTEDFLKAAAEQDLTVLVQNLHTLRGLCLNIGASDLGCLAGTLEEQARAGDRAALEQAAAEFRAAGAETVASLTRYLDTLPPKAVSAA
ncbi:ATP-binding protein [Thalassobaculum litoreum]|uniref:histidine kinase n=1 Tax=Thalassobaculum litoreum DSM 18839 TaxID=1123362 RepID=A0A8G2BH17_9PROT|nr:ATP-binding protein [Thalassobaculum litoreum]SDF65628.1 PAS domain S-box-containing protein [Thalassobaculum litoreum DSM 18839]